MPPECVGAGLPSPSPSAGGLSADPLLRVSPCSASRALTALSPFLGFPWVSFSSTARVSESFFPSLLLLEISSPGSPLPLLLLILSVISWVKIMVLFLIFPSRCFDDCPLWVSITLSLTLVLFGPVPRGGRGPVGRVSPNDTSIRPRVSRWSGLVQGCGAGQPAVRRGEPIGRLRPHPSRCPSCHANPLPVGCPPWLAPVLGTAFTGGSVAILWLWRPVWEGANALWCMFPLFPTALSHPVSPSVKAPCPSVAWGWRLFLQVLLLTVRVLASTFCGLSPHLHG